VATSTYNYELFTLYSNSFGLTDNRKHSFEMVVTVTEVSNTLNNNSFRNARQKSKRHKKEKQKQGIWEKMYSSIKNSFEQVEEKLWLE